MPNNNTRAALRFIKSWVSDLESESYYPEGVEDDGTKVEQTPIKEVISKLMVLNQILRRI